MTSYYNEFDPHAAAWLRELIKAGEIAPGDVDERSITDVQADDLLGYTQHHFFAGIGGWSRALRLAGIGDDTPIITGSCPCQPFSSAGKGDGFDDPRHLWPHFFRIIQRLRPARVVGEQVASPDALVWWDAVCTDLEGAGYAGWAADLCSAGIGSAHIRQRLYWAADSYNAGLEGREPVRQRADQCAAWSDGLAVRMAHSDEFAGRQGCAIDGGRDQGGDARARPGSGGGVVLGRVADDIMQQRQDGQPGFGAAHDTSGRIEGATEVARLRGDLRPGPLHGFWRDADWLGCRDGKWRPVKPGLVTLVDGLPRGVVPSSRIGMAIDADKTAEARAMRLKGYGNAIDPELAAMFLMAVS